MKKITQIALNAWQAGESDGNYIEFIELLSTDFDLFSQPLMGKFTGKEALIKMKELISERQENPNSLTFSNLVITTDESYSAVSFDSKGTVMSGRYPYEGYNSIQFKFTNDKVSGFREYFGFVDPEMFNAK
ncbi:hypothetical protein FGM00_04790 [Aggregatimonas sangjinii]|uniref:Nuclear transport factor 2 family protein n=1 Tax=Aggregatimonas sangjinii TaxID=2583587 RepID=A0A5B7SR99_9FLAO|nr:hypothetical protein [Aggregatimonas sangjinii]QCW99459.1 hypothetical protein FGM00_04790 [Aggregatimonas sangjinii]